MESYDKPRQHIKKQKDHFTGKGLYSQSYGCPSSHIWMWELDHKESWAAKNWCIQTVVLEKTFENALDCKEIKLVNPKGNQLWIFIRRTETEAPILWPPHQVNSLGSVNSLGKTLMLGQLKGKEEGGEDEMVR